MAWTDTIKDIVCLNLAHREDRLLAFTEQAEKYGIPFLRVAAIQDKEQGARGLRDTMLKLFNEHIERGTEHLLVFEDDALAVADDITFHNTMDKVVQQMPSNYHMIFLGCQVTQRISHFHSENIFQVTNAFSTHAVLYSLAGMKAVLSTNLDYPIDNHLVKELQPLGHCYAVDPLLFSQVPGHSDIGHNFIDWSPFIEQRHQQRMIEFKQGMR